MGITSGELSITSTTLDERLERLRSELERLRREGERLRTKLAQRPHLVREISEATKAGIAARDLMAELTDALTAIPKKDFFAQYGTNERDILKLLSLWEDDAARAGPLVDVEARWYANSIRRLFLVNAVCRDLSHAEVAAIRPTAS